MVPLVELDGPLPEADTGVRVGQGFPPDNTMVTAQKSLPVTDPRAHALRNRFHTAFVAEELPVPVEAIAEDLLGLHVEEGEIPCSGLLLPADRLIVLRADEPPARQRFTLAHELGHWVCQVREGRPGAVYCRAADIAPGADRLREREANVFAAELLMPEEAVHVESTIAASAVDLAARFGVSEEAMTWRLYNLGLSKRRPDSASRDVQVARKVASEDEA
jgi:hypothetical protein